MKAFTRSVWAFRVTAVTTLAGVTIAVLAGCSPAASTSSTASTTPVATPAPTVTVTVTPTPSASASPAASAGSPVTIACSSLVADSTIAAISPDFVAEASFIPAPDNSFGEIGALDGALCSWKNSESGSTIGVGVAQPSSAEFAAHEAAIKAAGTSTNVFGSGANRGYVADNPGAPEFDVFTESGYWIAVTSIIFDSPSAGQSIVANILETLPSG